MRRRDGYRVMCVAVAALLAGGCDGIWDLQRLGKPAIPDGPPDLDGPPPDGGGELGFTNRRLISEVSDPTKQDGEPSVTADALELYFKSDRGGGLDIWRSTRTTTSEPWGAPAKVTELSSTDIDTSPKVAPDGLTIWIQRTVSGSPGIPAVSTRDSRTALWAPPTLLTEFNGAVKDNQFVSTTPDQLVGYLTSEHGTNMRPHLFRTTRATKGAAWGTPVELPELISVGRNSYACPSPDDLSIIWSSESNGGYDVWRATRATTSEPFGTLVNLVELNNGFDQVDPFATPDLKYIVFTSTETGNYELFEATR